MMPKPKTYKVSIYNDGYSLVSDEPEERVLGAVALVDSLMKELGEQVTAVDAKRLAVLASLRMASTFLALQDSVAQAHQKLIDHIEQELSATP